MALSIEQKKAVVAEVADVANNALAAVAAEYRGLTVEEMTNCVPRPALMVFFSRSPRIPWCAGPLKVPNMNACKNR